MNRSRTQLDTFHNRPLSLHKPGVIPNACQNISPITSHRHKYELKQKVWPKQNMESWFENHSFDDRRAVFSFLNTLYDRDDNRSSKKDQTVADRPCRKSPVSRSPGRINTAVIPSSSHSLSRRSMSNHGHESRASKRDLGEILESLESFHPSSPSMQEKGIQTSSNSVITPLPDVNGTKIDRKMEKSSRRSVTLMNKCNETGQSEDVTDKNSTNVNDKANRRYLSQTWRVINPREDMETNVRPENNRSSFFNYTKKVYPEYFFIHPDWY